jgi:hypothetical protein
MPEVRYIGPHHDGVDVDELADHEMDPHVPRLKVVDMPAEVWGRLAKDEAGFGPVWELAATAERRAKKAATKPKKTAAKTTDDVAPPAVEDDESTVESDTNYPAPWAEGDEEL